MNKHTNQTKMAQPPVSFGAQLRNANGQPAAGEFNTATGRHIGSPRNVQMPISRDAELQTPDEKAQLEAERRTGDRNGSLYDSAPQSAWQQLQAHRAQAVPWTEALARGIGSSAGAPPDADGAGAGVKGTNPYYRRGGDNAPGTLAFQGPNVWTGPSTDQKLPPGANAIAAAGPRSPDGTPAARALMERVAAIDDEIAKPHDVAARPAWANPDPLGSNDPRVAAREDRQLAAFDASDPNTDANRVAAAGRDAAVSGKPSGDIQTQYGTVSVTPPDRDAPMSADSIMHAKDWAASLGGNPPVRTPLFASVPNPTAGPLASRLGPRIAQEVVTRPGPSPAHTPVTQAPGAVGPRVMPPLIPATDADALGGAQKWAADRKPGMTGQAQSVAPASSPAAQTDGQIKQSKPTVSPQAALNPNGSNDATAIPRGGLTDGAEPSVKDETRLQGHDDSMNGYSAGEDNYPPVSTTRPSGCPDGPQATQPASNLDALNQRMAPTAADPNSALRQALTGGQMSANSSAGSGAGSLTAQTMPGQIQSGLTPAPDWAHMFQPRMPVDWTKAQTNDQLAGPDSSAGSASGSGSNPEDDELTKLRKAYQGNGTGSDTPGQSYQSPQMQNDAYA